MSFSTRRAEKKEAPMRKDVRKIVRKRTVYAECVQKLSETWVVVCIKAVVCWYILLIGVGVCVWLCLCVCCRVVYLCDSLSIIPFTLRQFDFAYPMAYISICMVLVLSATATAMYNIHCGVWYRRFSSSFQAFLLSFGCCCFYFSWGFLHKHT